MPSCFLFSYKCNALFCSTVDTEKVNSLGDYLQPGWKVCPFGVTLHPCIIT